MFEDEFPVPCEPQEELVVLEVRGLVLSGTAPEVPLDLFTQGRLDKADGFTMLEDWGEGWFCSRETSNRLRPREFRCQLRWCNCVE